MKRTMCALFVMLLVVNLSFWANGEMLTAKSVETVNDAQQVENAEQKVYYTPSDEDEFREKEILITFTKAATQVNKEYSIEQFETMFGVEIDSMRDLTRINTDKELDWIDHENYHQIFKVEIPQSGKQAVLDAVKIIEQHPYVLSATPNLAFSFDVGEEVYTEVVRAENNNQGAASILSNTDTENLTSEQYAIDLLDLPLAWNICTGSSEVVVGVLDSGIDGNHPDLADNIDAALSKDYVNSTPTPLVDESGHGTHVAGIIGAMGDNDAGIKGVCWDVKIVSLKIAYLDDNGDWTWDEEDVVDAISYANEKKIPILNFSATTNGNYEELSPAIANYWGLFVCAAGNGNEQKIGQDLDGGTFFCYPSNYDFPNIISVASTNDYDGLDSSSNYGVVSVDLAAPGVGILSTVPTSLCSSNQHNPQTHYGNGYHKMSGTSMAAPQVAGVAALLLSYYPDLTAAELKSYILNSVDVLDYDIEGLVGKVATGGRLNAAKALRLANDYHGTMYDRFVTGDFNGDGKDDTACFAVFNDGAHSEIRVSLSNGTSAQPWDIWFQSTAFDAAQTTNRMVAGDFDGDGDDDIAVMYDYGYEETGKSKIFVFKSTGSSFGSWPQTWFSTTAFPATKVADRFVAGDFNGDGKDDIAAMFDYSYYMEEGTSKIFVFVSTGSSFGSWPQTWFDTTAFPAENVTGRFVAGDFNEDGKDDIAAMYDYSAEESGKSTIYVFKSTGSSFGSWPQTWFTNGGFPSSKVTNRFTAGDFDGDGDDDIGVMFDYSFQATGKSKIFVFKSTGSSFGSWPQTWFSTTAFPANKVTYRFAAGDLTGDGKADIAALYNYIPASQLLSTEYVFKSTGSSFGSWPQTWIATPSTAAATANVLQEDEYYSLHNQYMTLYQTATE